MIDERVIFVGLFLNVFGAFGYLIATLKGQTKPNKVTFLLWAVAPLIAFFAQIQQGVGLSAWMTFISGFCPLIIFIASFINKQSEWKLKKFDIICGSLSVIGLMFWYITQVGNVAIFFSIVADGLAALPTIVKAYNNPETENAGLFLLSGLNAIITLLTIKVWTFSYVGFPIYILAVCFVLYILIQFKLGPRLAKLLK